MTIFSTVGIFLLILIAVALGVPALVKRSRAPKTVTPQTSGQPTTPSPSWTSQLVDAIKAGTWWVTPLLLWVFFWSILFYLFPSAWHVMSRNKALFVIVQVLYAAMAFRGRNMVDLRGRPEKPWYPTILMFVIGCFVLVAIIREFNRGDSSAPVASGPSLFQRTLPPQRALAPALAVQPELARASHPTDVKHVATSFPLYKTTFVMAANEQFTAKIPAGYYITRIDGAENADVVDFKRNEQKRISELTYSTVGRGSAEITIWFKPDTK